MSENKSERLDNVLFSIYNPYCSQNYCVLISAWLCGWLLFRFDMFNHSKKDTYNIFIKDGILYTHRKSVITKFLKSSSKYKIFTNDWNSGPILEVKIYDHDVEIRFTHDYCFMLKGDKMKAFLEKLNNAYNEFITKRAIDNN